MLDNLLKLKIGIINTGACNIKSISHGIKIFTNSVDIINSKTNLNHFDALVVPGVGNFGQVMKNLDEKNIRESLLDYVDKDKPSLFICVGMQILFESSDEDKSSKGLAILKGKVKKIPNIYENKELKVPFIGWNTVEYKYNKPKKIVEGKIDNFYYFTHSFYVAPKDNKIIHSEVDYNGFKYCSSIKKNNLMATQFHPEKSGRTGLNLIKNFCVNC